ncbi:MAG TPA: MFS transporter [Streptosporangiaceae bacterium]
MLDSYRPVLARPAIRAALPGLGLSAVGDGMTGVAVPWLAIRLAPHGGGGALAGLAVAAFTLPGVVLAAPLARWLGHRDGRWLLIANAVARGGCLAAVPAAAAMGALTPAVYVTLLACSSVLYAWSGAGKATMVAELAPGDRLRSANSLLGTLDWLALLAGPALGGVLIAAIGAPAVLGIDALTWLLLGATLTWTRRRWPPEPPQDDDPRPARGAGLLRALAGNPRILALITLSFVFYLLYGPVEVALPVYVADTGSAQLLGVFWTLLAAGGLVGALLTGALRRLPLWPAAITIVAGWGVTLLPLGLGASLPIALAAFCAGGLIYAPYGPLARTLLQRESPPHLLARTSAAWSAVVNLAPPLGTLIAGPFVTTVGAHVTLLWSAVATIALAIAAAAVRISRAAHRP